MVLGLIFKLIIPHDNHGNSTAQVHLVTEQGITLANQFSGLQAFLGGNINIFHHLNTITGQLQHLFGVLAPHDGSKVFKDFLGISNLGGMQFVKFSFNVLFQVRFCKVFRTRLLGGLGRIPRLDCRIGGIAADQVFITKLLCFAVKVFTPFEIKRKRRRFPLGRFFTLYDSRKNTKLQQVKLNFTRFFQEIGIFLGKSK